VVYARKGIGGVSLGLAAGFVFTENMNINNISKEAEEKVLQILNKKSVENVKKIPSKQGVYLIYKKSKIIYVGKARNLNRRINNNHLSIGSKGSTSIFRSKIHKIYKKPFGKIMKKWILNNCTFAYEEIEDKDLCSLVEALLIIFLRKKGVKLLND